MVKHIVFEDKTYGTFEYIIQENDTVFTGTFYIYDENGNIKRKGQNVNNKFYGVYCDYYPDGKIESKRFRSDNRDVGEITWYRKDGILEKYNFLDDLDRVNFIAKYDEKGNIKDANGLILIEVNQFKLRQQNPNLYYKIGDSIKYKFMLPNIPNTTKKFDFKLKDFDNSKIKRFVKKIEPVSVEVIDIASKRGRNIIEAHVEYKFNDETKIVLKDSLFFEYNVK